MALPRRLAQALRNEPLLVPGLLDHILPLLDLPRAGNGKSKSPEPRAGTVATAELEAMLSCPSAPESGYRDEALAALLFALVLRTLPASVRLWFSEMRDSSAAAAVERYTRQRESPLLLDDEMKHAQAAAAAAASASKDDFSVRVNPSAREVTAVLELDDNAKLEMAVKLPPAFPLKPAEAEIREKVGVSEARLRKWLLSISVFLRNHNGTVGDAIELWRRNVEKEFEGLEECLICYSVIHPTNRSLPRLCCRTCTKKFHAACLYKWFRSSGKSNCPHCQSPW
uniref:E3 ubiquitin-protein ligase listerin n=1 Tax=Tetraselmis sp. GSL018 TaxID=582737 RepID=A0A061R884_9CHLO